MRTENFFRSLFLLLACAGCLGLIPPALAQTSFPMVWSTFPVCIERGKATVVTVYAGGSEGGGGGNLYRAYKALFAGEGLQAEIVPPEKGWPQKDPAKPLVTPVVSEVKMKVTVAPDARLGPREFRIATPRYGISTIGQVVIGDEPSLLAQDSIGDLAHAQKVTLPCVVNGRLNPAEKIDNYKFAVVAGQEVTFTALCARLENKVHDLNVHADPLIILRAPDGKELARNDDYYSADPLLDYTFEKAGDYILQIRDAGYRGYPHWPYALTMTTRPYITHTLPVAVRPGQRNSLQLYGFNLGDTKSVPLDVPSDVAPGLWTTQLRLPNGLSNPVTLLVSQAPQVVVNEEKSVSAQTASAPGGPHTTTASLSSPLPPAPPRRMALTSGVNAWLRSEWQVDRYLLSTKKGQAWGFEVMARRLGSQMDPELRLRDAHGNVLTENDDALGKDSRIDWTAPADGDYTLEVRGVDGHSGPECFYNLSSQPLRPEFRLRCDADRVLIAPGNRTVWYVMVERKYGFTGDVKVEVKGLPDGVTVAPVTIPAAMNQAPLFFSAAPEAHIDASLVEVSGTATLPGADGKPVTARSVAHPLMEVYVPGGGRGQKEIETQGVSVTEPNDIEILTDTQKLTLLPGGTAKIDITVKRKDYTKPVTLDLLLQHLGTVYANPLPPGVTIDEGASKTLLGDNETKGYITLRASGDAKPIQEVPIAVIGTVSINFVMKVWYASVPIMVTVAPPAKKP